MNFLNITNKFNLSYSDFTLHKDPSRQKNYLSRHETNENWGSSGLDTAGFWSRWLLWNLPDFMGSVKDIESRFGIKIDTSEVGTNSDGSFIKEIIRVPTPASVNKNGSNTRFSNINTTLSPLSNNIVLPPLPATSEIIKTNNTSNNTSNNYMDNNSLSTSEKYEQCKIEAADRKAKGKLKLCPEGYCTVKLTEEVYPSYWANLRASKICSGTEEDYDGKIEDYYAQGH